MSAYLSTATPTPDPSETRTDRPSRPEVDVRRLSQTDDAESAGRLLVAAYSALPGYPADEPYDRMLADLRAREHATEVAVALIDGRIVGTVTFIPDCDNEHAEFDDPEAASFRYFGVDGEFQGCGVGEAMVRWCIDRARYHGRRRIRIHTLEVMPGARRLYERIGFVRTPEFDEHWDVLGLAFCLDIP